MIKDPFNCSSCFHWKQLFIDSPRLLIACADLVSIGNKLVS